MDKYRKNKEKYLFLKNLIKNIYINQNGGAIEKNMFVNTDLKIEEINKNNEDYKRRPSFASILTFGLKQTKPIIELKSNDMKQIFKVDIKNNHKKENNSHYYAAGVYSGVYLITPENDLDNEYKKGDMLILKIHHMDNSVYSNYVNDSNIEYSSSCFKIPKVYFHGKLLFTNSKGIIISYYYYSILKKYKIFDEIKILPFQSKLDYIINLVCLVKNVVNQKKIINDFKPDNIGADEKNNPVLLDYDSKTINDTITYVNTFCGLYVKEKNKKTNYSGIIQFNKHPYFIKKHFMTFSLFYVIYEMIFKPKPGFYKYILYSYDFEYNYLQYDKKTIFDNIQNELKNENIIVYQDIPSEFINLFINIFINGTYNLLDNNHEKIIPIDILETLLIDFRKGLNIDNNYVSNIITFQNMKKEQEEINIATQVNNINNDLGDAEYSTFVNISSNEEKTNNNL